MLIVNNPAKKISSSYSQRDKFLILDYMLEGRAAEVINSYPSMGGQLRGEFDVICCPEF
jgi:hypothetical protein